MSTYRAQQAPRSTTAHRPLMAAALGIVMGAGFLASGASLASAADADPFCSEYEVPETVAPVEVAPTEVTAPVTVPVVVPTPTVPEVTVPPPTTTEAIVAAPAAVVPAEVAAPTTPKTSVLGEVVVNEQTTAPTLPVTGLPTGELLMAAAGLLIAGEGLRRLAARRVSEAIAAEMLAGAE